MNRPQKVLIRFLSEIEAVVKHPLSRQAGIHTRFGMGYIAGDAAMWMDTLDGVDPSVPYGLTGAPARAGRAGEPVSSPARVDPIAHASV